MRNEEWILNGCEAPIWLECDGLCGKCEWAVWEELDDKMLHDNSTKGNDVQEIH